MSAPVEGPLRVAVLAGGLSYERDVSLRSGRRVADALRAVGVEATVLDVDPGLLPALDRLKPDAVLPVLHGAVGEDGAVRGALDVLGLAYVGSGPAACRVAFDKPTAKDVVAAAGIAVPAGVALPHSTFRELGAGALLGRLVEKLGLPLMVKPARGGSALGCMVVRVAADLPDALVAAYSYGETVLVETFVVGTEVSVSVIDVGDGPTALPPVEIVPVSGVYDYAARYTAGETQFFCPARLDRATTVTVQETALMVHRALGLAQLSRADLVVDDEGTVWFLEANVAPGMTETSLLPLSVDAAGLSLGELCRDLALDARRRRART